MVLIREFTAILLLFACFSTGDEGRFNDAHKTHYENRHKEFPDTAGLGEPCDPSLHSTYVEPIYESIINSNLDQTIAREDTLIAHLKANAAASKKVCYGFKPKKIFTDYTASLSKYYDCKNDGSGTHKCVCLDREPLKHVPSSESVTGCKLKEPKIGDHCSRSLFDTEQKNQLDGIFQRFRKSKDLYQHRDAAAQWYGTDAYTYTILQSHYPLRQQICLNNAWSLACNKNGLCACRVYGPHFVFEPNVKSECVAVDGSVCTNWNKDEGDTPCKNPGTCRQLFSGLSLKGCGGRDAWNRAKQARPSGVGKAMMSDLSLKLASVVFVLAQFG